MKGLKVFALFILLHITGWAAAHVYMNQNPQQVLVVVDTSYAMKPKFPAMQDWIDQMEASARYQVVRIGTDKAMLGKLADLKSRSVIFRTAFGRMTAENLTRYRGVDAGEKILLSDGKIKPEGWRVVSF
ncbi:MAG: hypothetical protein ACPGSM_18125 [Thiolinea sp.]